MNLTPGDRAREAKYFYPGFRAYFIRHSNDRKVLKIARTFRKALADGSYGREVTVLSTLIALFKSSIGRRSFNSIERVRKKMKKL